MVVDFAIGQFFLQSFGAVASDRRPADEQRVQLFKSRQVVDRAVRDFAARQRDIVRLEIAQICFTPRSEMLVYLNERFRRPGMDLSVSRLSSVICV